MRCNPTALTLPPCLQLTLCGCTTQAQATAATDAWSSQVVAACEAGLLRYLSSRSLAEVQALAPAVTSVLFVIGELSLIALDAGSGQGVIDKHIAPAADGLSTGVSIKPSAVSMPARMTTLLQALLSRTMAVRADSAAVAAAADAAAADSAVASPDASTAATVTIPDAVRAHAYLCLGKLCLRDGALAKRYVTVFVRDLNPATSPAPVRNNILFVLGDLWWVLRAPTPLAAMPRTVSRAFTRHLNSTPLCSAACGTPRWWTATCRPWPRALPTRTRSCAATRSSC